MSKISRLFLCLGTLLTLTPPHATSPGQQPPVQKPLPMQPPAVQQPLPHATHTLHGPSSLDHGHPNGQVQSLGLGFNVYVLMLVQC